MTLFTFGYQKVKTAEALAALAAAHGIGTVIDVRFRPWPPRESIVRSAGLAYVGEPRLGNRLYKTDRIEIVDIEAVETILERTRAGESVAIMCACYGPTGCHRTVIAEECRRRLPSLQVVDL
jgi:hypothetical protein